jgi:hypothetical protein
MSIKSRIYLNEAAENKNPHVKADKNYVVAYIQTPEGDLLPALFTDNDISRAMVRATKNPEDVLPAYVEPEVVVEISPAQKGWLDRLLGR